MCTVPRASILFASRCGTSHCDNGVAGEATSDWNVVSLDSDQRKADITVLSKDCLQWAESSHEDLSSQATVNS